MRGRPKNYGGRNPHPRVDVAPTVRFIPQYVSSRMMRRRYGPRRTHNRFPYGPYTVQIRIHGRTRSFLHDMRDDVAGRFGITPRRYVPHIMLDGPLVSCIIRRRPPRARCRGGTDFAGAARRAAFCACFGSNMRSRRVRHAVWLGDLVPCRGSRGSVRRGGAARRRHAAAHAARTALTASSPTSSMWL